MVVKFLVKIKAIRTDSLKKTTLIKEEKRKIQQKNYVVKIFRKIMASRGLTLNQRLHNDVNHIIMIRANA